MSMLLRNFNRAFTVIRLQQFGKPRLASVASLELPRDSIFHYLPSAVTEVGPNQTLPIIDKAEKLVLVNHITKYPEDGMIGRPISLTMPLERDVIHYHRVNRKLRRMRDDALVLKDPRTLVVENYCLLSKAYRYQPTLMSWYEQWHNVYATFIDRLAVDTAKYNRQNYVILNVPDIIPSIVKMKRAETRRDNVALDEFRDPNTLMMLDLWTWLGVNKNKSMLSKLSAEQIKKVNFILVYKDRFLNLNLGELSFWRKDEDNSGMVKPDQMQRRLYVTATQIAINGVEMIPAVTTPVEEVTEENDVIETPVIRAERDDDEEVDEIASVINEVIGVKVLEPTDLDIADIDSSDLDSIHNEIAEFDNIEINEDENFEVVVKATEETSDIDLDKTLTLEESVLKACESFIEAGMLTTKEYQRITEQAGNYRKIENPFGDGLLVDMLEVPKASLEVKEEVLFEDPTILDKGLLKTTNANMTKQYIEEVLPRDICNAVVSIQKAGVIVQDYNVEHVVDAANRLQVHTLKVTPVNGESATLRFTTPWMDEEGYWTANDIQYTQRPQRVDIPIRKTSPNTVALTSFYGKNFIRRSEKVAQDRPKWLVNEIIRRGIDLNDVSVTNLKFADVFDAESVTPRDYSSVSMRLAGFTSGDTIFNFDYKHRNEIYSEAAVKHCEESNLVPIGLSRNAIMAMDKFNMIYQITDGKVEERGTLPELLGFDLAKEPKEFTEISMMGKDVPLALVFSYYLGLRKALKGYKVPFEVYEPAQRITSANNDIVLRFSDAKMVISPQTPEQTLLFNGLTPYLKLMRDFTIRDMDKKDVYLNLIQKNGLTNRYLNELELMDTMFVDPITERILKKMNEPVTFKGLLRRANEMLTNDAHPRETDAFNQHIYRQQRIAGAVYTEMVRSVREYRNKPGTRKKLEMQQNAVWQMISQDPSVMPSSNANPIQSMKEADVVTFGGEGGRSRRSMVKDTREYLPSDVGLISEATVDSGDVAITSYMTSNPIFEDIDGMIKTTPKDELEISQVMSSYAMLAPFSTFDDQKRINFVNIQHGSGIAADGYEVTGLRTGYEKVVAHRTSNQQTSIAEAEGKVLAVSGDLLTIEYTNKKETYTKSYKLGRYFGRHEGGIFPHDMTTNLKVGDSVKKNDVIAFNSKFFVPDIVNPSQVNWKAGAMALVALIEGADTLEDSSAISPRLSKLLKTQITKEKVITVRFDQAVHGLLKPGERVEPETILCTIEDSLTATSGAFTEKSLEHLQTISDQTPQPKITGVIDQIEVFYNGELDDMSESVRQIALYGDRLRKKQAAVNPDRIALTGQVDSSLRIGGHPVEMDTIVIRVYITQDIPAIGGDKGVFANQMKSTFRSVMIGKNTTEDGTPLDGYFGKKSVDERIVLSVFKIGTANILCRLESERCQGYLAAE